MVDCSGWGRRLGVAVVTAALLAPTFASPPSRAADPTTVEERQQKAGEWYTVAMAHMAAKRFSKAAVAFEEAFRLDPNATLLWNMGRAWEQAGDLERAKKRFEEFLAHDDVPGELRTRANQKIVKISVELERRKMEAEQKRREAELNKEMQRQLDEARRKADADAEAERERLKREIAAEVAKTLAAGQTKRVEKVQAVDDDDAGHKPDGTKPDGTKPEGTKPEGGSTANVVVGPPPGLAPAPSRTVSTAGWVSLALGAALAGGGAFFYVNADGLRGEVLDAKADADAGVVNGMTRQAAMDREADANLHQTLGVVGLGVGGAALVTGIVLLIVGDEAPPKTSVSTQVVDGGLLMHLQGAF